MILRRKSTQNIFPRYRFLPILTDSYRIVPIPTAFYRLPPSLPILDGIWMGYEWDMDGITDEGRAEKEWRHSEGRAKAFACGERLKC